MILPPHQLQRIFPAQTERLETRVLTEENGLKAVFLQPQTPDPRRNWEEYAAWESRSQQALLTGNQAGYLDFPDDKIDFVYYLSKEQLGVLQILPEDKVLLYLHLTKKAQKTARINFIARNKDPELKGVGSAFHASLLRLLKKQGIRHVTLFPQPGLENYWERQGYKPITSLPEKQRFAQTHHDYIKQI